MKNLFNKEEKIQKTKPIKFKINGKEYISEYDSTIKVQSVADDVQVYGWTLETRYKWSNDTWSSWNTHWGNKIYQSREAAIDAVMKIRDTYRDDGENWRISPLYKMNEPQYRDYKIDKLLGDDVKNKKTFEIKGWKLLEDYVYNIGTKNNWSYKKGTVFIQLEDGRIIISGTSISKHTHLYKKGFMEGVFTKGYLEEIEIKDEKWLHPHLLRELKVKLKIKK